MAVIISHWSDLHAGNWDYPVAEFCLTVEIWQDSVIWHLFVHSLF